MILVNAKLNTLTPCVFSIRSLISFHFGGKVNQLLNVSSTLLNYSSHSRVALLTFRAPWINAATFPGTRVYCPDH